MNIKTNTHGGEEVAGTKFLTWAILVVAAGLVFAVTTDLTSGQPVPAAAHTVQTSTDKNAS